MTTQRMLLASTLAGAMLLGLSTTCAQAGMKLSLANNGYTELVDASASSPGRISYFNDAFNGGNLTIDAVLAKSNSGVDSAKIFSQLSISSFTIINNTNQAQTLTLAITDTGFDPNSDVRPLVVYNSASVTSSQMTSGLLSFQTFAFDGTDYFRTSGSGVVATDAVVMALPFSGSGTTTADFSPINPQFSLTSIMTITLDAHAELTGFSGVALVHAPEPGSLASACIGLAAIAFGVRCRTRWATA